MCDKKKKCWKKHTQKNIMWESVILLAFFVLLIVYEVSLGYYSN